MGALSLYGRTQFLAAVLAPDLYPAPDTFWLTLTTSIPMSGDTGDNLTEPLDAAYARVEYGIGSDWWGTNGHGSFTNLEDRVWPTPQADWGRLTGWALCDGAVSGHVWMLGALTTPMKVLFGPGTVVGVGAGSLVVTLA